MSRPLQSLSMLVAAFSAWLPVTAHAQEIWLSPNGPNEHYEELLKSSSAWPDAANSVKVFKISTQFAIFASDAEFAAFIEGTKRLNFKIALEGLMLTSTNRCGQQVEGYTGPAAILRTAQRIQKYGAKLSYIAMDSVLIFGHEYAGPNACRDSIDSLAQQVAEKVAQARSVFPDVQVGDIEPIGNPRPGWFEDISAWTKAYQRATGAPLAFFDFDVDWSNPHWEQEVQSGARLMNSLHIPIAVTYNGSKREISSREWVAKAVEHFHSVEDKLRIHPQIAVIQSWNNYPEKMTPETNPETLSYVVREYRRWLITLLPPAASAQQVWFAPPDSLPRGQAVIGRDFDDLFSPSTSWDGALSHVNVFEITPRYSFASPEANLMHVLEVLGQHHVKVAVAMQSVTKRPDCGYGLEGMTPENGGAPIMGRMKKLGADVKYVVMDEPVYFAHFFKGPNSCQYDLNALVDAIVPTAKAVLKEYPDALIGEAEPVGSTLPPNWLQDLATYIDIYKEKVGRPLNFIQADITWGSNWQPQLRQLQTMLKNKHVKLGVIFNAPGPGASDEAWVANAIHNIDAVDSALDGAPGQAIIQSWTKHPSHILPETSAGSLTAVLRQYVNRHPAAR